jgi:DNA-binding transcriptional LysR family regulator
MKAGSIENMSMDLLRTFCAFVETGKVDEAAKKLKITQASVSLQLKKLEKDTGLNLFSSVGRKKILSASARDLFQLIAPPFQELELRLKEVSKIQSVGLKPSLRLGYHTSLASLAMTQLKKQNRLQLQFGAHANLKRALQDGGLDALVSFEPVQGAGLLQMKISEADPYLVFHSKLSSSEKWSDLRKVILSPNFIELEGTQYLASKVAQQLGEKVKRVKKVASCEDPASLINLVSTLDGWGIHFGKPQLRLDSFGFSKFPEGVLSPIDVWMSYPKTMKGRLPF